MLLHDAYALHRKWWDPTWKPGPGDTDWTTWDYILADAYQVIEDYTDSETGQYLPYDQSGEVFWETRSKFSGSKEALDKEMERRKDGLKPGESLYAVPVFMDEKNKPTLETWFKDLAEDTADRRPEKMRNARPPTAEELAAMG